MLYQAAVGALPILSEVAVLPSIQPRVRSTSARRASRKVVGAAQVTVTGESPADLDLTVGFAGDEVPTSGLDLDESLPIPPLLGSYDDLSVELGAGVTGVATVANEPSVESPPTSTQRSVAPPRSEEAQAALFASAALVREIAPGDVLRDRYVIEQVVGIGGNSVVYQAIDRHRDAAAEGGGRVAVKILHPPLRNNPYALLRMRREFRQMQQLTHHGIARVFDLDCDAQVWFMTLELIVGETITRWLKGTADNAAGMQIIAACCEVVAYAHSRGIVHGDLKPSNVLVAPGLSIKLMDFGSTEAQVSGGTTAASARSFAATPPFASPQVLTGVPADPRDDVFSLACIAYAVLTRGEHPFQRKSSLDAYAEQLRPAYSPKIQPRVFDVIVRALSWQRPDRPASARAFLNALVGNALGRDLQATPAVPLHAKLPPAVVPFALS